VYDVVVIGGGPAGLSAAIYAKRAGHSTVIVEKGIPGGQIAYTHKLENYLGFSQGISGGDFSYEIKMQAERLGVEILSDEVIKIDVQNPVKKVIGASDEYPCRAIILAVGAGPRKLGVPGEGEFSGRGVSYCATCDGAFFRNREVAVVGGGDTAFEDALYLSGIAKKVNLIHRRSDFRAQSYLVEKARKTPNIEFIVNTVPTSIEGKANLEGIRLKNNITGEESFLHVEGIFAAVGRMPDTAFLQGVVELDKSGYIVAGEDTKTNVPGIYAAGDARTKGLRQVVTAAADGAIAANFAHEHIVLSQ
jgi:thioredoxin reductase (NADPH)